MNSSDTPYFNISLKEVSKRVEENSSRLRTLHSMTDEHLAMFYDKLNLRLGADSAKVVRDTHDSVHRSLRGHDNVEYTFDILLSQDRFKGEGLLAAKVETAAILHSRKILVERRLAKAKGREYEVPVKASTNVVQLQEAA